jgi:hypothetical protein
MNSSATRHAAKAEGSPLVRSLIASAMCAVEEEMVTQEQNKLPAAERLDFMLTYECFVVYALRIGVERIGKAGSFEKARTAIENHYLKYAYFDPKAYESVWRNLDRFMGRLTWVQIHRTRQSANYWWPLSKIRACSRLAKSHSWA